MNSTRNRATATVRVYRTRSADRTMSCGSLSQQPCRRFLPLSPAYTAYSSSLAPLRLHLCRHAVHVIPNVYAVLSYSYPVTNKTAWSPLLSCAHHNLFAHGGWAYRRALVCLYRAEERDENAQNALLRTFQRGRCARARKPGISQIRPRV